VLLHVFSDGDDNASDELRKQELHTEKDCILQRSSSVHHRFLYNFNSDTAFHRVKSLGENLGATVIFVKTDDLKRSIEERDKIVFRTLNPHKNLPKKKLQKGWNMLKGDKPDLVLLHKQLQKAEKVFQGDFLKTEGIFRENGNFRSVENISTKLALGTDTLEDYTDPILTSHALKNLLHHYEIIPRTLQLRLLAAFSSAKDDTHRFHEISTLFRTLPDLNLACLNLVLTILRRVVHTQQTELPSSKALTTTGIALIFSTILLGQVESREIHVPRQSREIRDPREFRESREFRNSRQSGDPREFRKSVDPREFRKSVDPREFRKSGDPRELVRDSREKWEGDGMGKMVLMSQCVAFWLENGEKLFGEFG